MKQRQTSSETQVFELSAATHTTLQSFWKLRNCGNLSHGYSGLLKGGSFTIAPLACLLPYFTSPSASTQGASIRRSVHALEVGYYGLWLLFKEGIQRQVNGITCVGGRLVLNGLRHYLHI